MPQELHKVNKDYVKDVVIETLGIRIHELSCMLDDTMTERDAAKRGAKTEKEEHDATKKNLIGIRSILRNAVSACRIASREDERDEDMLKDWKDSIKQIADDLEEKLGDTI